MALEIIATPKVKKPLSTKQCIVFAIISFVVGIAIFILAYISINHRTFISALNQPILSFMVSHREPYVTSIMQIITNAASATYIIAAVAIIAGVWAFVKREIWRPLLLVIAMGATIVISTALKSFFMIDRPPRINMIVPFETDFSFPSGHTISIAVLLLVVGYLIYSRRSSIGRNIIWAVATILGIGAVAISRLYLGYHWLADITASIGLALAILAVVILVDRLVIRHFKRLE